MRDEADLAAGAGVRVVTAGCDDHFASYYQPRIEYTRRPSRALHLGLLSPLRPGDDNDPELRVPLVVYVQGSGFNEQDLALNIPQLSVLAHQGYVVATVEYRPASEAPFPGQIADVRAALEFLTANAGRFAIDPARIALWGGSSGGYTVTMLAVTAARADLWGQPGPPWVAGVRAVVDFFGPVDFLTLEQALPPDAHPRFRRGRENLLGGPAADDPEFARWASPLTHLPAAGTLPPFLIVHGDQDDVVPMEQSLMLHQALGAAGHTATFSEVRGAGHGTCIWIPEVFGQLSAFLRACL
jgi:acetyl esterase/lipase